MGRLFWKFFFIFWLAQIFTVMGVGTAVWALRPDAHPAFATMRDAPPFPPPGMNPDMRPLPEMHAGMPPPPGMRSDIPPMRPGGKGFLPPLLPILAGSVASLVFAALLAWYFARPIRNLRGAFDAVANGKLETRIGPAMAGRNDELAELGHDFDRMAARLQSLMESQRRLLHDVSHELRSPLARLQAATDLMRQQPGRAAELIDQLERDTVRMDALVGELLTLARLDSGMAGRMDEKVELREVFDHIVSDAQFEAQSKQCMIDIDLPECMPIKGNHELIFRALENVVRNAVLHSPAGTRIGVTATRDASGLWLITVYDQGPGVPPDELETIFEPFYRGKKSGSQSGYGLGLAMTRRVIQAHGGKVTAKNRAEGGLAIIIVLPVADA
ncbi:MAG TPA: ATP-binding protein [Gallionella sp.]|nr:ATP-binding protein [Gallionella sp.]